VIAIIGDGAPAQASPPQNTQAAPPAPPPAAQSAKPAAPPAPAAAAAEKPKSAPAPEAVRAPQSASASGGVQMQSASTGGDVQGRIWYSPLVKKIAREEGISGDELRGIRGTGHAGRVSKKDV